MRLCVLEHASYGVLGLLLDLPQVTFTAETLGIDLVNILRAGRPRGKPSVLGNHLDSTERKTVPRSGGKLRAYWLAGKFRHVDLIGRERLPASVQNSSLWAVRQRGLFALPWAWELSRGRSATGADLPGLRSGGGPRV
jgi:hypothetical protein